MLRSARLIVEDIKIETKQKLYDLEYPVAGRHKRILTVNRTVRDIKKYVQKGDQMTGFEIIASLPLEEQQAIKTWSIYDGWTNQTRIELNEKKMWLQILYTWNGESWEE